MASSWLRRIRPVLAEERRRYLVEHFEGTQVERASLSMLNCDAPDERPAGGEVSADNRTSKGTRVSAQNQD